MISKKIRYKIVDELMEKQPEVQMLRDTADKLWNLFKKMCSSESPEETMFKEKYPDFVLYQEKLSITDIVSRNHYIRDQIGTRFNVVTLSSGECSNIMLTPNLDSLRTISIYYNDDFPKFAPRKGSLLYWDEFISTLKNYVLLSNKLYEKEKSIEKFLEITSVPDVKRLCPKIYELYEANK